MSSPEMEAGKDFRKHRDGTINRTMTGLGRIRKGAWQQK